MSNEWHPLKGRWRSARYSFLSRGTALIRSSLALEGQTSSEAGKRLLSHPQLRQSIAIRLNVFGELSPSRHDIAPVRFGSIASVSRSPRYVRSSPESGRVADIGGRLKSANTGNARLSPLVFSVLANSVQVFRARALAPFCRVRRRRCGLVADIQLRQTLAGAGR